MTKGTKGILALQVVILLLASYLVFRMDRTERKYTAVLKIGAKLAVLVEHLAVTTDELDGKIVSLKDLNDDNALELNSIALQLLSIESDINSISSLLDSKNLTFPR